MQWPSQLRWLHNCWNATNDCWIVMKNVLWMGIIAFTHACQLSSQGNSWMTVVGWFLQMKATKQSGKQRGLMFSDKKFHFRWLWRPTCALSSSLIWLSDWWVWDKNCIYPLIFRLITELLDKSHFWLCLWCSDGRHTSSPCFLIVNGQISFVSSKWLILRYLTASVQAHYWQK